MGKREKKIKIKLVMKKLLLIVSLTLFAELLTAQFSKTVNVTTPGTLATLAADYLNIVTQLTITGNIDQRDIKCINEQMLVLKTLDMSGTSIKELKTTINTGYWADELPDGAFSSQKGPDNYWVGKTTLETILLPNNIKKIGRGAFASCSNLSVINLPLSLISIDDLALFNCDKISSLNLPTTVKTIGKFAFSQCDKLTSITLPNDLEKLGLEAFTWCKSLKEFTISESNPNFSTLDGVLFNKNKSKIVTYPTNGNIVYKIPESVLIIDNYAFKSSVITLLEFSSKLNEICIDAFNNCENLNEFIVPEDNQYYSALNGVLMNKNGSKLIKFPMGKSGNFIIPNSINIIGKKSFERCSKLLSVTFSENLTLIEDTAFYQTSLNDKITFPEKLDSIGKNAFSYCSFKIITCLNPVPPKIGILDPYKPSSIFYSFQAPAIIFVPANSVSNYKNNYRWKIYTIATEKHVTVNNPTAGNLQLTLINEGHSPISEITSLTLTGNLNNSDLTIIKNMFTTLTEIDMRGSVLEYTLGQTFNSKLTLTKIVLPNTTNSISDNSFSGCSNLMKVTVPILTPPQIYTNTFYVVNKNKCIIEVPIGTIQSYKSANYWKDFQIIIEENLSNTNTPGINSIKVYNQKKEIIVEGSSLGEVISIFDTTGKQLKSQKSIGERIIMPVSNSGVYIVKTDDRSFKVVI